MPADVRGRLDLLTIARRVGGKSRCALNVYGHLFGKTDEASAAAIDETLRGRFPIPVTGH